MGYRSLSEAEMSRLKDQDCIADEWHRIQVKDPFLPERVRSVSFSGTIQLGVFNKRILLPGGMEKECGIFRCHIHNCTVGDNAYISNVGALANYDIAGDAVIESVGAIRVTGPTSFGNGVEIDVLNEVGGRTLKIFDQLSAQLAYMIVFYRHDAKLLDALNAMIDRYVATGTASRGMIGTQVRISNSMIITNMRIGAGAQIEGASCLEEGTLQSCLEAPVTIGTGVSARKFIVLSGSKIDQSAILEKCFVGQSVRMGKQYSAENSAIFCNSELFHGEGCSVFAGPYTVSHHKSSLLIAGFFSFYNAGSGTNQSNHMYKLGPVHQGILERGSKTGSFSYLSWPNCVGPFTAVIGKNYSNFDTTDLPFSLIREHAGKSICIPGWNLFTVGTKRDGLKWPARDGRKDADKLDLLHFQVLSPFVVGKMLRGLEKLRELSQRAPEGQEYLNFNGISIPQKNVNTSCEHYEMAVRIFLGECLLRKLDGVKGCSSIQELRHVLAEERASELYRWIDVNGMYASESAIAGLVHQIVDGNIKDLPGVQEQFSLIHRSYEREEWKWCAKLIEIRTGKSLDSITMASLITLVGEWKAAALKCNDMMLQDAMKEFAAEAKLGYGRDGDDAIREADFAAVRGTFEQNSFFKSVKEDNAAIEARAEKAAGFLKILM